MVIHPTTVNLIQYQSQLVLVTSGHKIAFPNNQEGIKQQYYEVVGTFKSIKRKPQPYLKFEKFLDLKSNRHIEFSNIDNSYGQNKPITTLNNRKTGLGFPLLLLLYVTTSVFSGFIKNYKSQVGRTNGYETIIISHG